MTRSLVLLSTLFAFLFLPVIAETATAPPTISPYTSNFAQHHAYLKSGRGTNIGNLDDSGSYNLIFFNDYDSAGTIRVNAPMGFSSTAIEIKDYNTGAVINTSSPLAIDYIGAKGKSVVAYLTRNQRVTVQVVEPSIGSMQFYPINIDYFPDTNSNMSEMDWLEAAISRTYRSSYIAALGGELRSLDSVSGTVDDALYAVAAVDYVAGLASMALSPDIDNADPRKIKGFVVNSDNFLTAMEVNNVINIYQKREVGLGADDPSLTQKNLSSIYDGLTSLGTLAVTGDPADVYRTIMVDFAQAFIYAWGVFGTSKVEKGINAEFLVEYLMANHIGTQNRYKYTDLGVTVLTDEWAEYSEDNCGWLDNWFAGCGMGNYDADRVVALYNNNWSIMQQWIAARKTEANWYADVDGDGWENSWEIANGYDPNDRTSPPPPEETLNVTSPTYNMTFEPGDRMTVKWMPSDDLASSSLKVELIQASGAAITLASNVAVSAEQCVVSLPSSLSPYSNYKIRLTTTTGTTVVTESQGFTIESGSSSNPTGSTPNAYGTDPEYQTIHNVRGGETVKFKVRGTDLDGDLDYVLWTASDTLLSESARPTARSNYVTITDTSDNMSGSDDTATSYIQLKGSNVEQYFYVYASVYDAAGNMDSYYWKVEVEPTFGPVLSPVFPNSLDANIGLGEHDLEFSVSDADDNLDRYEAYIDGVLYAQGSMAGGTPAKIEDVRNVALLVKRDYTVKVVCYDDDGLSGEMTWTLHAGVIDGENQAPTLEYFRVDSTIPFQKYRLNKGYEFDGRVNDADENLAYVAMLLNGTIIDEDTDASPDATESLSTELHFTNLGINTLTFLARDSGGLTTTQDIVINVLPDDGTGSNHAPVTLEVYPTDSTLYGTGAKIEFRLSDDDADLHAAELYIDGVLDTRRSLNGDVADSISFDIPSGTHTAELWIADVAGNRTKAKTWILNSSSGSSVAPKMKIVGAGQTLYVPSGERADIQIYGWDASGDMDRVVASISAVGDPDGEDYAYMSNMVDEAKVSFRPTRSGRVTLYIYDDVGNRSTGYVDVVVTSETGNHAPMIWSTTYLDGDTIIMPNYDIMPWSIDAIAFDPDGDLLNLSMYVNGVLMDSDTDTYGEFWLGDHIYEGSDTFSYDYPDYRGEPQNCVLRAVDSKGNITEMKFTIIPGPVNGNNHAPEVPATVNLTMDQDTFKVFTVPVVDEEGDTPVVTATNLSEEDSFEQLLTGELRYTPADGVYGSRSFTLSFDDGYGGKASSTVNVSINRVFYPPRLTQYSFDIYIDSPSFDLGSYLRPLAINDACSLDEIVVTNLQLTNCTASGNKLGLGGSLRITPVDPASPALMTGVLQDLDSRQSREFTVTLRYMDTDSDGMPDITDSDDDNDEMPDDWERANDLDPLVNDADADPDLDDFTNLQEYQAGTDPQLASSFPDGAPAPNMTPVIELLLLSTNKSAVPLRF